MTTDVPVPTLNLKDILVPSKNVEVDFPGFADFKVSLTYLSRDTMIAIRKKATKLKLKGRSPIEELDDTLFLELYVKETVKGWSGLKLEYVEQLAPVDFGSTDPKRELPFSPENALFLMKNSTAFDSFVSDTVSDLSNFRSNSSTK